MAYRPARGLLRVSFLALTLLAVLAAGAVATGQVGYVITNGVSMNPLYHQGDPVVVGKADSYKVGQIVAYRFPAKDLVVLHRIIGGDARGYVMKGDNNQSTDVLHPTPDLVVGRAILHLPQGGLWLHRVNSPTGLGLIAFAMLAGSGGAAPTRRRRRRGTMSRHATTHPGRSMAALLTAPPWVRTAAATTATVGVLGLALAPLAWAGPLTKSVSSQEPASGSMTFSYTAAVPKTPAYDGTTVASPDPVFRKLANIVDVHYAYRGSPGSVTVSAQLSTPSGWHSTVPLAAPKTITTNRYDATVRLDLLALNARAQAAAAVIGIPTGQVTIDVIPLVETTGGARFAPTLSLSLSALQLTLTGGAPALVVKDATEIQRVSNASRTIGVLGRTVTLATARTLSTILLLAALLGALALALIAQRSAPTSEGARIRRRYAPQLVSVQPMPAPPGRPMVDVADFATLARLAERYELLVLHWARSDVETFVVQDEGTTYRYLTNASGASNPSAQDALVETHLTTQVPNGS